MNTTNFLLLAISLTAAVTGLSVDNKAAKQLIRSQSDVLFFHLLTNLSSTVIMLFYAGTFRAHGVTVLLALLFGLCNMIAGVVFTLCFHNGPMSLTSMAGSGGCMLVTTVLGIILFSESVKVLQIIGIVLILFSICLLTKKNDSGNIRPAWFLTILLYWIFAGSLGIIQKLQGATGLSDEKPVFLLYTFLFCTAFSAGSLLVKTRVQKAEKPTLSIRKVLLFTVILGITGAMQHIINLKLAIEMPSAVFFPINSGGSILLSSIISSFCFHEKITRRQKLSFAIGFFAIFLIAGIFG